MTLLSLDLKYRFGEQFYRIIGFVSKQMTKLIFVFLNLILKSAYLSLKINDLWLILILLQTVVFFKFV